MTPEEIQNRLLYRDGLVLVLDKPAGIPVHVGPKGGETLEDYFKHLCFGWAHPPALAHRLDRDTSGCLVLGRHPKALRKLGKLFSEGLAKKTYWAITHGHPPADKGRLDFPLSKRSEEKRGWWMKVDLTNGKPSITDYIVRGKTASHAWLELSPLTGRTHQIRVHLAEIGCPIVGETIYAGRELSDESLPVLHLHSRRIILPLSKSAPPVSVTAEPPPHMLELLKACGWKPDS